MVLKVGRYFMPLLLEDLVEAVVEPSELFCERFIFF
jgi:hypothetical protein